MKRKGLIGWLVAIFFVGVFAALFLFILVWAFKLHVTMTMVDFYFWNKEYDVPLAMLSTDIGEDNFVLAVNKIHYEDVLGGDYTGLGDGIQNAIDFWLPPGGDEDYKRSFSLTFEDEGFGTERGCKCKGSGYDAEYDRHILGHCSDECEEGKVGIPCIHDAACVSGTVTQINSYGSYPIPLIFNGSIDVTELRWSSSVMVSAL